MLQAWDSALLGFRRSQRLAGRCEQGTAILSMADPTGYYVRFSVCGGYEFVQGGEGAPRRLCVCCGGSSSRAWVLPLPRRDSPLEEEADSEEQSVELQYMEFSMKPLASVGLTWCGLILVLGTMVAQRCIALSGFVANDGLPYRDSSFNQEATQALWLIENCVQLAAFSALLVLHV